MSISYHQSPYPSTAPPNRDNFTELPLTHIDWKGALSARFLVHRKQGTGSSSFLPELCPSIPSSLPGPLQREFPQQDVGDGH